MRWLGTTILCVRRANKLVMIGDGQVTLGPIRYKTDAKKIRKLSGGVVCGFAGNAADALALVERLETQIEKYPNQTLRACVNIAKAWRTEKYLRNLNASLIVADKSNLVELDGTGNIMEVTDGVIGIGSGGTFALSAARALLGATDLDAEEIAKRSMSIAADLCIHTNRNWTTEVLTWEGESSQ